MGSSDLQPRLLQSPGYPLPSQGLCREGIRGRGLRWVQSEVIKQDIAFAEWFQDILFNEPGIMKRNFTPILFDTLADAR